MNYRKAAGGESIPIPRPKARLPAGGTMKRILVIDDEPLIRWALAEGLKSRFDVTTAADVAEARRRLAEQRFDGVISDLRLPDGTGMQIVESLRAHAPDVKIFVITAYGSDEVIDRLFSLEVDGFIRKPFEIQIIADMLEAHLRPETEPRPGPS